MFIFTQFYKYYSYPCDIHKFYYYCSLPNEYQMADKECPKERGEKSPNSGHVKRDRKDRIEGGGEDTSRKGRGKERKRRDPWGGHG